MSDGSDHDGPRRVPTPPLFDVVSTGGRHAVGIGATEVPAALRRAGPGAVAHRLGETVPGWALTGAVSLGGQFATATACLLLPDLPTTRARIGSGASGIHLALVDDEMGGVDRQARVSRIDPRLSSAGRGDDAVLASLAEHDVRNARDWHQARMEVPAGVRAIVDAAGIADPHPPRRPMRSRGPFEGQGPILDAADAWLASLRGDDADVAAMMMGESPKGASPQGLGPALGVSHQRVTQRARKLTGRRRPAWMDAAATAVASLGPAFALGDAAALPALAGVDRRPQVLAFALWDAGSCLVGTTRRVMVMPMPQRSWDGILKGCRDLVAGSLGRTLGDVRGTMLDGLPAHLRDALGPCLWDDMRGYLTGSSAGPEVDADQRVEEVGRRMRTRVARAITAAGRPMSRPELLRAIRDEGGKPPSLGAIDNVLLTFHTYSDGRIGLASGLPWDPPVVRAMRDAVHAAMGVGQPTPMDAGRVAAAMAVACPLGPDPKDDPRLALSLLVGDDRFVTRSGAVAMRADAPWPTMAEALNAMVTERGPMTRREIVEACRERHGLEVRQVLETWRRQDGAVIPVAVRVGGGMWGLWGRDVGTDPLTPTDGLPEATRASLAAIARRSSVDKSRSSRFRSDDGPAWRGKPAEVGRPPAAGNDPGTLATAT